MELNEIFQEIESKESARAQEMKELIGKFNSSIKNAREIITKEGEVTIPVQGGVKIDEKTVKEIYLNVIYRREEGGRDKTKEEKSWPVSKIKEIKIGE